MSQPITDEQAKADAKSLLDIARCLRAITDMYDRLSDEAVYASNSDMLGGDAMVYLGPAANLEAWEHRYEAAEERAMMTDEVFSDYASDQDAEWHPLLVLATWSDAVRDERDQPTDLKATVQREADYLAKSATWMFDPDLETGIKFPQVDAFINDLHRVRSVLENVLKDGVRHDTGAPCMRCKSALVKVYAAKEDGSGDYWKCDTCKETSTTDQYRLAVRHAYLCEAERLTATDILEAYRIMPGTLMVWATRGKVRKRGKDDSGRQLYDVDDAVGQRDKDEKEGAA